MANIQCVVVTPEATVIDEAADFVVVPLFDGEKGIGVNHAPLIGRLGFGELRLTVAGKVRRWYVDGGFVQVTKNSVALLTNRATAAGDLKAAAIQSQLEAATKLPGATDEQAVAKAKAVEQSRAQLRVAAQAK